jgi:hypothetical protein
MKQASKSNNVVSIQKAIKPSKNLVKRAVKSALESLLNMTNALYEQHNAYHEQYVVGGNAALYKLLGNILAVCIAVRANPNHTEVINELRKYLLKSLSIKVQKNTSYVSVIVRYVVRAQRKTVHLYSRAIQSAIDAGITQATFESFVAERGGLERIRRSEAIDATHKNNSLLAKCDRNALANALVQRMASPIAAITPSNYPPLTVDTEFTLLLAVSGRGKAGLQIVGSAVPNAEIEKRIINDYMHILTLSALDPLQPAFRKQCQALNINEDLVLRWAAFNQFAKHTDAFAFCKFTVDAANKDYKNLTVKQEPRKCA